MAVKSEVEHSKRSPRASLLIGFRFLAEFTSRASSLITFPLMARYLGTEGYGINSQTSTIVTFLVPVATLGMGFGVVRIMAGNQTVRNVSSRLYSTLLAVMAASSILSLLMFFMAPLLNEWLIKVDSATEIIRWSSPLILLTAAEQAIKDYYRARLRIISYSVLQALQTITYVAAVAVVLTSGGGLLQVVWAWLGIKAVFNIIALTYFILIKEIEPFPSFMPVKDLVDILRFGFPIVISGLGSWVTNVGDRWVIGYFMNINDVAVYNAAYTLAGVIGALASPFWNPLYPEMASAFNNQDNPALHNACRKYTNGFTLIGIPAAAGLILLADPLLVKIGSPDFSIDTLTFTLIILGLFIEQVSANAQYLIYLHNEPKLMRNVTLLGGVSNIILNVIFVPLMGITGAALATFCSYLLMNALIFRRIGSYEVKVDDIYDFKTILKFTLATLLMAGVLITAMQFVEISFLMTLYLAALGGVIYLIALWAIYGFNFQRILAIL